jgi:hypothetical protein
MQSATLPFELRVHALESRIFGLDHPGQASAGPSTSRNIQRRIEDIEEALERASQSSDALKRLIEGCESFDRPSDPRSSTAADPAIDQQYLPLLTLADHQPRNEDDAPQEGITESDLLPDSTKLTMVMEAAGDIKHAERLLRDIELLKTQEVEGSGQLHGQYPTYHSPGTISYVSMYTGQGADDAELLPYRGALIDGIEQVRGSSVDLLATRREVNELLRRYNEFVSEHWSLSALRYARIVADDVDKNSVGLVLRAASPYRNHGGIGLERREKEA